MGCMEAVQSFDSSFRHDNMRITGESTTAETPACEYVKTQKTQTTVIRNMEASLIEV